MSAGSIQRKHLNRRVWLMPLLLVAVVCGAVLLDGPANLSFALTGNDCIVCHDGNAPTGEPYINEVGIESPYYTMQYEPDSNMKNEHHYFPVDLKSRICNSCHSTTYYPDDSTSYGRQFGVCINCHYTGTPVRRALDTYGAHAPSHNEDYLPETFCIECHSPYVLDEHSGRTQFIDAEGDLDCFTCHNATYGGIGAVETLEGNTFVEVTDTGELTWQGVIGNAIMTNNADPNTPNTTCLDCHTDIGVTGHAADHDNVVPNAGCDTAGCHQSNVMIEHTSRPSLSCNTCHGNDTVIAGSGALFSPQQVIDASAGPFAPATTSYCTDCHGPNAGLHAAAHDQGFFVAVPNGQDCSQCHASMDTLTDPNQADLVTEHVGNQGFGCQVCHNQEVIDLDPADVANAIDIGSIQDMPVYCVDCHAPTGQGEGHLLPVIYSRCSLCHRGPIIGGVATDIRFGSDIHTNIHIPAGENAEQSCAYCHSATKTACTDCHTINGPTQANHDFHSNFINCSYCHTEGVPGGTPVPPPYNECSICHDGTDGTINIMYGQPGHDTHIDETNGNCSVCHTAQPNCAECHVSGHQPVPQPFNACDECHTTLQPGQVTHERHKEVATNSQGYVDCTICHSAQPRCTDCHGESHHSSPQAQAGDCANCHTDPRNVSMQPNGFLPKQLGCDVCHVRIDSVDATSSTLTILAYDPIQPTGRPDGITKHPVTRANGYTNDHVFTVTSGAGIKNYGACFGCHKTKSDGTPLPFHGHYAVDWQPDNFTDPFDDRPGIPPRMDSPEKNSRPFGSNAQWAPGRGIFNVFETARRWPNHFYNNYNSNPKDNVSRGNQYNQDVEGYYGPPAMDYSFAPINWKNDASKQFWLPNFDVARGVVTPSDRVFISWADLDAGDSGGGGGGGGGNDTAEPYAVLNVEGECTPGAILTAIYGGRPYAIGACAQTGTFAALINLPVEDGYTNTTVWRNYFEQGTVWVISEGQGYDWYYGGTISNWDGCWEDGYRWNSGTLSYSYDPTCSSD